MASEFLIASSELGIDSKIAEEVSKDIDDTEDSLKKALYRLYDAGVSPSTINELEERLTMMDSNFPDDETCSFAIRALSIIGGPTEVIQRMYEILNAENGSPLPDMKICFAYYLQCLQTKDFRGPLVTSIINYLADLYD